MTTPQPNQFLVQPINDSDLIVVYRGSDISRPLFMSYRDLLAILTAAISGGGTSGLLLQTNSVTNPVQDVLNLIEGSGISIVDNGLGGITISATGGGGTYTVDNGLYPQTPTNFRWGGALVENTLITNNGYFLKFSQSTGKALELYSIDAEALLIDRINGSRNTVETIQRINRRSNTSSLGVWAQSGFGGSIDFDLMSSNGSMLSAGKITVLWNNPITSGATSSLQLSTVDTGVTSVVLGLGFDGSLMLPFYGVGTFLDTPVYLLGVNASGEVVEVTPSGGGGITSIDGDTTPAQTLSIGTSGTSPNWVDDGVGNHELNIPLASTVGVTEGTISHSDYNNLLLTAYPYVERQLLAAGGVGIAYSITGDLIFTNTGTKVDCFNATTGLLASTTPITSGSGIVYVKSIEEVWAFTAASSVTRFNALTGAYITVTLIAGLSGGCRAVYDNSLVNNKVYAYIGGNLNTIDVTLFTRTLLVVSGFGGSYELTYCSKMGSAHYGYLVGQSNGGIWAVNTATNLVAIAPTFLPGNPVLPGNAIKYSESLDAYIVSVSVAPHYRIVTINAATATTFTLDKQFHSMYIVGGIVYDDVTGLCYATTYAGSANQATILTVIDIPNSKVLRAKAISAVQNQYGYVVADFPNKTIYVSGYIVDKIIIKP